MRILSIPLIFLIGFTLAQKEYAVETIDLINSYNNSYRKPHDPVVEDVINAFSAGEISCYAEGLNTDEERTQTAFFQSILMREMNYGPEYFFASDINLLKVVSVATRDSVYTSHLQMYISEDHPDNLMGRDRFIGSFKMNELRPYLEKYQWFNPANNADSLTFWKGLMAGSHGHLSREIAYYNEQGVKMKSFDSDLWKFTWSVEPSLDNRRGYFKYEISESMKWKGVADAFPNIPRVLMKHLVEGDLNVYSRKWNGEGYQFISIEEVLQGLLLPLAEDSLGTNTQSVSDSFSWSELSFNVVSEVVFDHGYILRIPKTIDLIVPYCAKGNIKGVDIPLGSFMFNDLLKLQKEVMVKQPFSVDSISFCDIIKSGMYYPSAYWVQDIYGNEVIACDVDGKGRLDLYGGIEGMYAQKPEIGREEIYRYALDNRRHLHVARLSGLLLRQIQPDSIYSLTIHQPLNSEKVISSLDKVMKKHPNGFNTRVTTEFFNYSDESCVNYMATIDSKWHVSYEYVQTNDTVTIKPKSVYWFRGDGLEWFSVADLNKVLGKRKFKKLFLDFDAARKYLVTNNLGGGIVRSGKPAHEIMPYHSYVVKFVQSLEE